MDEQNKNLILAVVLSGLVMLVWMTWFAPTPPDTGQVSAGAEQAQDAATLPSAPLSQSAPATSNTPAPEAADAPRVDIQTGRISGSISLTGGRIDDLQLLDYDQTLDEDSDNVRLLSPVGSEHPYYAVYGWAPGGELGANDVPGPTTQWALVSGETLTPDSPVVLEWSNDLGMRFQRTISVDDDYMFTVRQSVLNGTDSSQRVAPYGLIERRNLPEMQNFFVLHEGVVRLNDNELAEIKYKKMPDMDFVAREGAQAEVADVEQNGWIGFTDKYWMTTIVPKPGQGFRSVAKYLPQSETYQAYASLPTVELAAGESAEVETFLFAGAKEKATISQYEDSLGIERFIDSIDWGWFYFLTKPIFFGLHWLNALIGNMGWAIIGLTLILKAALLPLAYKSYVSMAKMKELQPEMEKIKERAGDDRAKLQQETMALYKKERVNPAAGCLPLLLQIPIFFSLYKVIFVTIELRHAPWFGWIRDLSAPDPSSILNLFGLLPFAAPDPNSLLAIVSLGVLPILLGISMWLQQKLNPTPTDPAQAAIFAWMPWIFMFMLGTFASGLVLYWITNNVITFIQQYLIMRSHGHKPDVIGNILRSLRLKKKEPAD
ncbi:membrane protein insertase YidC [Aliiroseovarius sp. PTFE2010]|uniref:membrane protein insertase YidC n=1 Tax=Aliiroseovarius sp. PTFE2010 TaxID=3417190 RepID=UPI003CF57392